MLLKHNSPNALLRLRQRREEILRKGMPYNGYHFQADPSSMTLVAGRALRITQAKLANETIPDFTWRTTENAMYCFNADEFLEFADLMDQWVEERFQESWV